MKGENFPKNLLSNLLQPGKPTESSLGPSPRRRVQAMKIWISGVQAVTFFKGKDAPFSSANNL